jgi:hypothetical protein
MTYGRILLIGALAFGAIYYFQSEQAERAKEAHRHETALQEAAKAEREAVRYREQQEREKAEIMAEQRRSREQANRELAQQYLKCFGRPIPADPASMSEKEWLDLYIKMNPNILAANAGIRSCGE